MLLWVSLASGEEKKLNCFGFLPRVLSLLQPAQQLQPGWLWTIGSTDCFVVFLDLLSFYKILLSSF
jgi:hypothetical protein